jgi:hypothetical protein
MIRAFRQPDETDQFGCSLLAFRRRDSLQEQRQRYILAHVHCRQQIEELKNKSDLAPAELGQSGIVRRVQGETIDKNFAGRGMIEAGEEMNQSAFAAPARSADGDKFMACDFQGNAVERVHGALAARIFAD